jgi:hypothetical protein
MEQHTFKNIGNCLNTNIYSYLETSSGQSSNLYLNIVHFFNTRVNYKSVTAEDSCFPALAPNMCYYIELHLQKATSLQH